MNKTVLFIMSIIVCVVFGQSNSIRKGERGLASDFVKSIAISHGVLYAATDNFVTAICRLVFNNKDAYFRTILFLATFIYS